MNEKSIIRILVADDHPLMRAGIIGEINAQSDMRVVAEATDGNDALELFRIHRPDIILMDLRMPKMHGIDAMNAIRGEAPRARIIVLTTVTGDIQIVRAFKAGAAGFLLKETLRNELVETIRIVHSGGRRIPPDIAQQIAEHAIDDKLTLRELEILRGVAQGHSNKIVASDLNISEHTVKNHIKSILSKLNADDRTHAVMIAVKRGYIEV